MINANKTTTSVKFGELWGFGSGILGQLDNDKSQYNLLQVGTATTWVSASSGQESTMGLQSNGTLWGWGSNTTFGQLGFNDIATRVSPVQVGTLNTWTKLTHRYQHTLATKTDGTLWSWGQNLYGELGLRDFTRRSSPVQVGTLTTWTNEISNGLYVSHMIKNDGTLWSMGANNDGMLGWGSSSMELLPIYSNGQSVVSASANGTFTVYLKNNGTLWSFGSNELYGMLGLNDTTNRSSPVQIGTRTDWSKVSTGGSHTMAIRTDGTLWAWGRNQYGNLGDNSQINKSSPVQVGTLNNWANTTCGIQWSLAIKTNGTLWSWGRNLDGTLGTNNLTSYSSPVQVGTLTNWSIVKTSMSDSIYTSVSIKTDGTLWSWGTGTFGALGDNSTTTKSSPVQIGTLNNWSSIAAANHILAIKTDGTLWTWGNDGIGQLGQNAAGIHRSSPVQIGTLNTWSKVFAWSNSSMAIKTDGTLWTWGNNAQGQLGIGDFTNRSSPVQIGTRTDWLTAAVTSYSIFAANSSEGLLSAGKALNGSLLLGREINLNSPVQIGTRTDWSKVSTGLSHTMAIRADGTLWTWGLNNLGAFGNNTNLNTTVPIYSPIQVGTLNNWSNVQVGFDYTHAIKTNGTIWGWGNNSNANIGDNSTTTRSSPVQIGTLNTWTDIYNSLGNPAASIAKKSDNTLWGWGWDAWGQLGKGTVTNKNSSPIQLKSDKSWKVAIPGEGVLSVIDTNGILYASGLLTSYAIGYDFNQKSPVQIGTLSNWSGVNAGPSNTTVLSQNGSLWGFGYNLYGTLGDNTVVDKNSPIRIGTLTNWASVSNGYSHTMAIKTDGTLWAWGFAGSGQTGTNNGTNYSSPVQIGTLTNWYRVSAANTHTLALKTDGTLWSWGLNTYGALGNNSTTTTSSPIQVGTLNTWSIISTANSVSWAIKTDGTLWSWGYNAEGQLGQINTTNRSSPVQIGTLTSWTNLLSSGKKVDSSGFATQSDGTLWAWGYGFGNELGLYHPTSEIAKVMTPLKFTNISAGGSHTMAVASDGSLWGWGLNSSGQLGTGNTTATTSSPVQIGTLKNWSKMLVGWSHTMAIKTDGTLWGWGFNTYGQIGDGTAAAKSSPVQIGTLTDWSTAASGNNHTLALKTDGTIWTWGFNGNGELGLNIGTAVYRSSPVQIGTQTNWAWVGAGSNHSLGVKTDGTLWSWGRGGQGEGGRNTNTNVSSPVQVGTLTNWLKVQGGGYYSMAIKTDGSLWGWGFNNYGQVGNMSATTRSSPVQIGTLTDWLNIHAGKDAGGLSNGSTLAIKTNGTLWAWGLNSSGQNAQGEIIITARSSPVQIGTNTYFASGSFGQQHGVALLNDGTLASWGLESTSVLGQFLTFAVSRSSPSQVGDFNTSWGTSAVVSVGVSYTMVAKTDGTLWGWGLNTNGQLGTGNTVNQSSPVQIGTLNKWKSVACGASHTIAFKEYS